jgi:pimeloyl-ACP methyl ester carboxylesterase
MRRQFQYITLIAFCVILTNKQFIFAQNRGAVWVHGLKDNSERIHEWVDIFTEHRAGGQVVFGERTLTTLNNNRIREEGSNSDWRGYRTADGVNAMANTVLGSFQQDPQNIYFGHSMGGVTGRAIDVNNNGAFGGIITAGSPLDGARIANSARNNDTNLWAVDGIERVTRGPFRQFGPFTYNILNLVVNDIGSVLLFPVFDAFGLQNNNNQGVTDLQENSNYMNSGIRNAQTNTPKIHIWGNENSQGFWRLTSQAIGNGDDDQWLTVANTAGDVYEVAMWVNIGLAIASGWWNFGLGAIWYIYTAEGWSTGADWWRDGADRGWNYLIGSGTPSSYTVCYQALNGPGFRDCMESFCQGGACNSSNTYPIYISCQQQNTYDVCYTYYSSVNGQSDAFIKVPSQQGFSSAWSNNAVKIEAQGVNHLEMKKHERMGQIYNDIFNGGFGVNQTFIVPIR